MYQLIFTDPRTGLVIDKLENLPLPEVLIQVLRAIYSDMLITIVTPQYPEV